MKAAAALIATGLALTAAGCAGGNGDDGGNGNDNGQAVPPQGRAAPELVQTTVVKGGSAEERRLLRRVVAGMDTTTIERITISAPGARRETDDGEKAVAITFTPVKGVTSRRQWDEWIIAGAFSRRLLDAELPAEVDGADERGGFTARPKLKGKPDPRPLADDKEDAVVKGIRDAAEKSGGTVEVEVHHPYGLAVTLSVAPENPASFLKSQLRPLLRKLDSYRAQVEGVYLTVLDAEQRLVLEWGSWSRNPAGSYWVRRDLADCSPIRQSEPPGTEPAPTCPA